MKKFTLLLLCALLLMFSVSAESYDIIWEGTGATCGDNLSWSVEGTTLYITGSGDMYDFSAGAPWAAYKYSITQVILSDTVTSVGAYAFQDYDSITNVYFGTSLVTVGKDAFSGCDGLTAITLPATFKKFGENCFRSCSNLKTIYCSGGFPRFDDNCLWDTYTTIVYSASNPWSVSLIEQLETAFHNRIEFRSSDGTDPYVPTQPTEATQAPTQEPTQETFWVTEPMMTEPVTTQVPTIPVYTEPTAAPTVATLPPVTQPPATQPTIVLATEVPSYQPYGSNASSNSAGIFVLLMVVILLAILATGALLVHTARGGRRKNGGKYRR